MTRRLPSLKTCIILDVIGCISYIIPFFGPVWAPISGIIFYFLFGRKLGLMGGVFSFIEELIPVVDFIPTFTIAYFIRKKEMSEAEFTPGRAPVKTDFRGH